MASVNVTAYYNGGSGLVGYVGGAKTARFKFTVPATGANKLTFTTKRMDNNTPDDASTWATAANFRYAVSTSASAYNAYAGYAGTACGVTTGTELRGTVNMNFQPNTVYYLFIFPNSSGYYEWYIEGLTGNAVTLTGSYATASSISATDGEFGQPMSFTIARNSDSYTHSLTVQVDDDEPLTLYDKTSDYPTLSWTPNLAQYATSITDKASVPLTVTLETFSGNTSIGTASTTVQLSFRKADVGPAAASGWYALSPLNESKGSGMAAYIDGISKARATFDASKITLGTGATLSKLILSYGGTRAEADLTASPVTAAGPILNGATAVTLIAQDSRGFTVEEPVTLTPNAYTAPVITDTAVFRCDRNGTAQADGDYLSIQATVRCANVAGLNQAAVLFWSRTLSGQYVGSGTALVIDQSSRQDSADGTRYSISTTVRIEGGYDPDVSYELKLTAADTVGYDSTALVQIPTRKWAMKFNSNATAVAFGKAPEHATGLEIPSGWEIWFGTKALLDRFHPVGSIYESTDPANPGTFMGGTWESFGAGLVLVGAGNGYTAGDTGGEATHTLTKAELPAEGVGLTTNYNGADYPVKLYASNAAGGSQWPIATYGTNGVAAINTENLGSGQAHENMQPYVVVYRWRRTA